MSGTGVGFSCEQQNIQALPRFPKLVNDIENVIVVDDSKLGWALAFRMLFETCLVGLEPHFNYNQIRPAGAPLKTMGGRASGPEPLKKLFDYTVSLIKQAAGRAFTCEEVHSLVCNIAEIVVVGGVRRSALISLSDLANKDMRDLKSGFTWYNARPYLAMSNNSAVYTNACSYDDFSSEWDSLVKGCSGERGIFNRDAHTEIAQRNGRRNTNGHRYGTNPCSEIILRSCQFCNLTEVVIRATDTFEDVKRKVEIATVIGTLQSMHTNFPFLSPLWKQNCEEERLLGVSFTGICDNLFFSDASNPELLASLRTLREHAITVNKRLAGLLHINPSAAITCVKPSGTVSQLVNCASGIHPRYAPYYIRRVRCDKKDPLYEYLSKAGVPVEDEAQRPTSTAVFSFPIAAPENAKVSDTFTAVDQLRLWRIYQDAWCEHKPSCSIYVRSHEWDTIKEWVWKHFPIVSGLSFFPYSDSIYKQAPYEQITRDQYLELCKRIPSLNWNDLDAFDRKSLSITTRGKFTISCAGANCEIVDITP